MIDTIEHNRELVKKLNIGSQEAFKTLYNRYFRALVAFASQYIDYEEAKEVTQESMLWIWENRTAVSPNRSIQSLLFTMVKNKSLNIIAHEQVRRKAFVDILIESKEIATTDDFVTGAIFDKYNKIVSSMPETYKEAFELNRLQKLTHKEIAEYLKVSPQTVNYRICQALKLLRDGLQEYKYLIIYLLLTQNNN